MKSAVESAASSTTHAEICMWVQAFIDIGYGKVLDDVIIIHGCSLNYTHFILLFICLVTLSLGLIFSI